MLVGVDAGSRVRSEGAGALGGQGAPPPLLGLLELLMADSCFWKLALIVSCVVVGPPWARAARGDACAAASFAFNCVLRAVRAARRICVKGYRVIILISAARGAIWTAGVGVGKIGGRCQRRFGSGFAVAATAAAGKSGVFLFSPVAGFRASPLHS